MSSHNAYKKMKRIQATASSFPLNQNNANQKHKEKDGIIELILFSNLFKIKLYHYLRIYVRLKNISFLKYFFTCLLNILNIIICVFGQIMPKIKRIICQFIFVFIAFQSCLSCQLVLRTHERCKNSESLLKIFEKLINKHSGVKNEIGENIYVEIEVRKEEWNPNVKEISYPSIVIRAGQQQLRYEGQPSYVQIQYYMTLVCYHKIPLCSSWMQPIYPINIPPQPVPYSPSYISFLAFLSKTTILKSCLSPSVNSTSLQNPFNPIINSINQLLHSLPLFDKFSHNLRNYLLQHRQRTVMILFYGAKIERQLKRKQKFQELIQFIRMKDKRIGYHISDQARERLIFATHKTGTYIGNKLLEFMNLKEMEVSGNFVIGFRFKSVKTGDGIKNVVLERAVYKIEDSKVFDNKFIYWLQQLALTSTSLSWHPKLSHLSQNPCITSSSSPTIIHLYNPSNISQVLENLHLYRMMQLIKLYQTQNSKSEFSYDEENQQKYGKFLFEIINQLYQNLQEEQPQERQNQKKDNVTKQSLLKRRIQEILSENKYKNFKWNVKDMKVQIKQQLYSYLPSVILCLNGEQPLRFSDHDHLFQYLLQSRIVLQIDSGSNLNSDYNQQL